MSDLNATHKFAEVEPKYVVNESQFGLENLRRTEQCHNKQRNYHIQIHCRLLHCVLQIPETNVP